MHLAYSLSTLLLLAIAWLMAVSIVSRPNWQLRQSAAQGLLTAVLAVEAAACIGLWELQAASGLATWTPTLLVIGGGAMAVASLRRGRTPAEVQSIRHWRGGVAFFAVSALVVNWKRIEAFAGLGRTELEANLLANASGIAGFAALALVVVAVAPIVASQRQRWLRRGAVPLAAALLLIIPMLVAPAAVAVEVRCDLTAPYSDGWCGSSSNRTVETYAVRSGGWHPEGGVLSSYSARMAGRVPIEKADWNAYHRLDDASGLRIGRHLAIDGHTTARAISDRLYDDLYDLEYCFERAEDRGTVGTGSHILDISSAWPDHLSATVNTNDSELDACVRTILSESNYERARGGAEIQVELVYLGEDSELALR